MPHCSFIVGRRRCDTKKQVQQYTAAGRCPQQLMCLAQKVIVAHRQRNANKSAQQYTAMGQYHHICIQLYFVAFIAYPCLSLVPCLRRAIDTHVCDALCAVCVTHR